MEMLNSRQHLSPFFGLHLYDITPYYSSVAKATDCAIYLPFKNKFSGWIELFTTLTMESFILMLCVLDFMTVLPRLLHKL